MTGEALAELYASLVEKYPIVSIEDPFDQDDWESVSYGPYRDRCPPSIVAALPRAS